MLKWVILFLIAFIPPVIFVIAIRNVEHYQREPWTQIFLCFLWGATIAVIAALILEIILDIPLSASIHDYSLYTLILTVVIAPIVEEFTKPLALRLKSVKKELLEIEDGFVYGAAAGLGFSATENLLYEVSFLSEGLLIFIVLVIIRTIGGCSLHASATAMTGYGYSKSILYKKPLLAAFPFFILAILMHGTYNFIVSFNLLGGVISIGAALIFALLCLRYIIGKIHVYDQASGDLSVG
jgi:RsiW-degrading membrane proteinase PrsW (M82 family)